MSKPPAPLAPVVVTFPAAGIARIRFGEDGPDSFAVALAGDGIPPSEERLSTGPAYATEDLRISVDKTRDRVDVSRIGGGPILTELRASRKDDGSITIDGRVERGSSFYGGGERTGFLDKTGEMLENWNTDANGDHTSATRRLYQSHPFIIVLCRGRAFGILFDNVQRTYMVLDRSGNGDIAFGATGGPAGLFVLEGPTIKDVLRRLADLTGHMPLPPLWSLGYHQCRWSYHPADRVRELARTFREKDVPCDAIWLDIDYMDRYRCFTWDRKEFTDPEGLIADLREDGFDLVTIVDPGISKSVRYPVWVEGLERGYFCTTPGGEVYLGKVWPKRAGFPDFTRADVRDWWAGLNARWIAQGLAGVWNDMNEPATFDKPDNTLPDDVMHATGAHDTVHNIYALLEAAATVDGLRQARPDERPFLLTRAGFTGIQRYAAVWTGDNGAIWEHLLMAMPMCLNLGLSGVPFVGTDVGGFNYHPSTELFVRWTQLGTFSPFFRAHTREKEDQEPWSFGPEAEDICRRYIRLRYELLPYTYGCFREASLTGVPVMRALLVEHPDDPETLRCDDQYLWGRDLLVAPVYLPGRRYRLVYLPAGAWTDWWTGERHEGCRHVVACAQLGTLPLYVREGAIIPARDYGASTKERGDEFTLHVFAPAEGEAVCEVYDDDGRSLAYERGEYRLTRIACTINDGIADVRREVVHDGYLDDLRFITLRVHAPVNVRALRLDGRNVAMERDGAAAVGRASVR